MACKTVARLLVKTKKLYLQNKLAHISSPADQHAAGEGHRHSSLRGHQRQAAEGGRQVCASGGQAGPGGVPSQGLPVLRVHHRLYR